MPKDIQKSNGGLLESAEYKIPKAAVCSTFAAAVGFFASAWGAGPAQTICDKVSDTVAIPIHDILHGQTYEERTARCKN